MDNSTKNLLIGGISFLAGAAIGGAGMFFYSKRYFQEKSDAEIKDMADYYNNKYADDILKKKEEGKDDKGVKEESNEQEQAQQKEYVEKASIYDKIEDDELSRTNYTDMFRDSKSGDSSDSASNKKKKDRKKKAEIEIVDDEVWNENPGNLDTKFIVFYDADNTLVDEDTEQIVDDPTLVDFINKNENEAIDDTMILQDNKLNTLYHVTIMQAAFSEVGLDD